MNDNCTRTITGYYHFPEASSQSVWNAFAEKNGFVYTQRNGLVAQLEASRLKIIIEQVLDEDEGEDAIT